MSRHDDDPDDSIEYANIHVEEFLQIPLIDRSNDLLQVIDDGSVLTVESLYKGKLSLRRPILVQDTPQSIGMRLPKSTNNTGSFTVRDVGNTIGMATRVDVIDVQYQQELDEWTLGDLVEYFEDRERLASVRGSNSRNRDETEAAAAAAAAGVKRPRRKASERYIQKTKQRVLNQISLEFSRTPLRKMVTSPTFVRQLDWVDNAWPKATTEEHPTVQYYCLTSGAGSYTDFHVDFGGTSVWYHVLQGAKQFCLVPPTSRNLQKYKEWLCHCDQAHVFFPSWIKEDIVRMRLDPGETLIIPSGWIHAVYTPVDSLVFGGNFLHGLDIAKQIEIFRLETACKVKEKYRFPLFRPLVYYVASLNLKRSQLNETSVTEEEEMHHITDAIKAWWNDHLEASDPIRIAMDHCMAQYGCSTPQEFLTLMEDAFSPARSGRLVPPSDITSTSKSPTKFRLKLSSSQGNKPQKEAPKFRISLSESACRIGEELPGHIKVKRSKAREDLSSYVNDEEDWIPPGGTRSPKKKSKTMSSSRRVSTKQKPQKAPTSVRNRLNKKLR